VAQHLKRWESPRKPGRNHKGRGGTARQRQLHKRTQTLRKRLTRRSDQDQQISSGEQVAPFFVPDFYRASPLDLDGVDRLIAKTEAARNRQKFLLSCPV